MQHIHERTAGVQLFESLTIMTTFTYATFNYNSEMWKYQSMYIHIHTLPWEIISCFKNCSNLSDRFATLRFETQWLKHWSQDDDYATQAFENKGVKNFKLMNIFTIRQRVPYHVNWGLPFPTHLPIPLVALQVSPLPQLFSTLTVTGLLPTNLQDIFTVQFLERMEVPCCNQKCYSVKS